jgi:hypothetical protein
MAEEQLREIIDAMRVRIQAELDTQIQQLTARHAEALERLREETAQAAEAKAEKRWSSKVDAVRIEWAARLESEVAAARADAEKRLVAEAMRARADAEKAAADAAAQARRELDQAVAAERRQAEASLAAERKRGEQELEQTLAALDAERSQLEADAAQRARPGFDAGTLLAAARSIEEARSLSEALAALVRAAGAHAPRVTLFVVNGTRLDEWSVPGMPATHARFDIAEAAAGMLGTAVRRGAAVVSAAGDAERSTPAFASLPPDRTALAVPLLLADHAVAVLYADEGDALSSHVTDGWMQAVELLARHAAACMAHLTAVRTLQLLRGPNGDGAGASGPQPDDDLSARRYAKLLVSEIKLYNEVAVRAGRQNRDLMKRLGAEIDRARHLYESRVSNAIGARGHYFQDELVQTLAGGDPALLG